MFRLVMIVVLCAALFTAFSYFNMYKQADRFNARIQNEILGLFDRRAGLDSIQDSIQRVAKEENIILYPSNIQTRIVSAGSPRAAGITGIAVPDSGGEAIEVTTIFSVKRFIFTQTYSRTATRQLHGSPAGGHSTGFPGGVNLPGPGRDIHSHRQSIDRAVKGRDQ